MSSAHIVFEHIFLLLIGGLLVYGSVKDIFYRSVPNIVSFFIFCLVCGFVSVNNRVVDSSMSFIVISSFSLLLYRFNVFGGADAKVLMALSPLVPLELFPHYFAILSLFLFVTAIFYLVISLRQFLKCKNKRLFNVTIPFFVPVTACYFFVLQLNVAFIPCEMKWSQRTGQLSKVCPKPMEGYENGEAPEFYRSV